MKTTHLQMRTTADLVDRFAAIGMAQDDATLANDVGQYNRLFDRMSLVIEELKRRPGDQRTALLSLYQHENIQVRLMAATSTLAVAPGPARRLIEFIASSGQYPQAGDAGMTLSNLDRGIFKPR